MRNKVTALRLPKGGLKTISLNPNKKLILEEVERYDFLPVVLINGSEEPKNAIISTEECAINKLESLNLGGDYDNEYKNYKIANIVVTKNSIARIPLKIKRGYDPLGLQDEDGILEFRSSNGLAKLNYIDNDDTDYENDEGKYDLKDAEYGDEFVLEIDAKSIERGKTFTISVYASDDDDGWGKTSKRKEICGKFNVKVVEKDVFMEEEYKKGVEVNKVISRCG
ncbi:MAG: hypothetical protein HC854_01830 [Flavobacterium sp.]|nr:hypothetical protein [Flavobacterium sp.]